MSNNSDTGRKLKSRTTSAQVAELAQVSQSAVSRAFTPGASVAPSTREKVMQAAQELGYRPNAIARSLISGRSRMIGLLAAYLDNQFYPIVVERLGRALQAHGYHTLLFITEDGDSDQQLEKLLSYQVDAVVMLSATLSSALARECRDAAIPVVLFNRDVPDSLSSSVVSDNEAGGRLVGNHLLDTGHKRIAYIAGDEDSSTNRDREAGFTQALADRGQRVYARRVGGYSFDGAVVATEQLMQLADPPDAIFVANDYMAFAVMDTLRIKLGISVPEQVAVVGFDDVPQAGWDAYSLTTVVQPTDQLIEATVSLLLDQLKTGEAVTQRHCLPVTLVKRNSTQPG
ncbi:MAG: LacI family DNA-binding transcriptional regulator [Granulosicoccus sp.]